MKRQYIKHTIHEVKDSFEKEGYTLLSKEYVNINTKLNYICPEGHHYYIDFHHWLYDRRCPYCSKKMKKSILDVIKILNKHNYSLLSKKYINANNNLEVKCNKGHIFTTTWHRLNTYGIGCFKCKQLHMVGPGNPNWKGGISYEPYCPVWKDKEYKEDIKLRDGNKCLNPGCSSKKPDDLVIHHIDYDKKNCGPNNLITICRSCNGKANIDREWHKDWYTSIIKKRYYTIYHKDT